MSAAEVFLSVEGNDTSARRARGGLDADAVFEIGAEESVGVSIAEIRFGQEGEFVNIVNALNVVGCDALRVHQVAVVFHVLVNVLDLLY